MDWMALNIMGTEWIIVVFVALVLILGTGKLPAAARKMGRAAAEFEKAKNDIRKQINQVPGQTIKVNGPVETERQKLEAMARSVGVDPTRMTDDELRETIRDKIGGQSAS